MAKRKKKLPTFSLGTLILSAIFLYGVGLATAHYLEPKGLTKEICVERMTKLGAPLPYTNFVCNGVTFSVSQ